MNEQEKDEQGLAEKIPGVGQKIIGEIELIGGALTGDPTTVAEGELNLEIGDVREELDDEMDETER
jgi:uncharacterized protein YjbJ (UPF0337 family)